MQIFCRCVTFAINAFIVRTVGRDVLGIMNVRLLLLESTLLFLSKEAINRAALSSTTQHHSKCSWAQLINQMWLTYVSFIHSKSWFHSCCYSVPICTALSIPCLYIWLNLLSPVENHLWTQYKFGCLAMTISCILELCAEAPLFIAQVFCFVKLKVVLDTLHIFVRSVVFISIVLKNPDIAIYAFGIAQLASIFAIVVGYYAYFYTYISKKDDDPSRKTSEDEPDKEHTLADKFPLQSVAELLPGVLRNKVSHLQRARISLKIRIEIGAAFSMSNTGQNTFMLSFCSSNPATSSLIYPNKSRIKPHWSVRRDVVSK